MCLILALCQACGDDGPTGNTTLDSGVNDAGLADDGGDADVVVDTHWGPTSEFDRFCVQGPWEDTLVPSVAAWSKAPRSPWDTSRRVSPPRLAG